MQVEAAPSTPPPVEPASRAGAIADTLREQILTGRFRPGDRLPSERGPYSIAPSNRATILRSARRRATSTGIDRGRRTVSSG